ncbi:MAG: hypothetical protein M1820_008270 [Bogoriella megaspora]|nr:MAG: hypothetical protein M1820_008270 [Bogoriella megaspora]
MTVVIIDEAPLASEFVPLSQYQASTPEAFFDGKEILHYYTSNALFVVDEGALNANVGFSKLRLPSQVPQQPSAPINGDAEDLFKQTVLEGIDIWVTSKALILFSNRTNAGLKIPYPYISLHALQRLTIPGSTEAKGLLLQALESSDNDVVPEEECEILDFTLVPTSTTAESIATTADVSTGAAAVADSTVSVQDPAQSLFDAVSACADLHPTGSMSDDMMFDDENEGGAEGVLGMPGEGGWITSENIGDYMDEKGNFVGAETLGAGAGTVRAREDDQGEDTEEDGKGGEETKWRRTD